MFTATNLLYPVFLLIVFSLTVILIPRKFTKIYDLWYAGSGLGDVLSVFVYQNLLGLCGLKIKACFMFWGSMLCHRFVDFTVMIFCIFCRQNASFFMCTHWPGLWPVSVTVM